MPPLPLILFTVPPAMGKWAAGSAQVVQALATGGLAVLAVSILLCLFRLTRGPSTADRGAALDVIGVQLVGIIILLTMRSGSLLYVDGILIVSLLAFAGTIAVAQFVARPFMRMGGAPRGGKPEPPASGGETEPQESKEAG